MDDALGEAYDKTARLLGLNVGGGGGPALEALAKHGDPKAYKFPVPLRQRKNCDFSYAGLKTAVRMAIERDVGVGDTDAFTKVHEPGGSAAGGGDAEAEWKGAGAGDSTMHSAAEEEEEKGEEDAKVEQMKADIAASFQQSAVRHLEERTRRAVEWANDSLAASAASSPSEAPALALSCVVVAGGGSSQNPSLTFFHKLNFTRFQPTQLDLVLRRREGLVMINTPR